MVGVGWGGGSLTSTKSPGISKHSLPLRGYSISKSDISSLSTTFLSCPVLLGASEIAKLHGNIQRENGFPDIHFKTVVLCSFNIYIHTNTKKSLTAGPQSTPNLEKIEKMVKRVKFPDVSDSDWHWCIKLRLICLGFKVSFILLLLFSNPSDLFL